MNILILNWRDIRHPRAGGAEVRLFRVYAPLARLGHKVVLYCCAFPGCEREENLDGIEIHRLGNDATFSFLCMLKLRGWVEKHAADVVVEDFNKLPFYSPLAYKGPLVIQMHHLWKGSIFRETVFPMAFFIWASEEMIRFAYRKCPFSVVSESTRRELQAMRVPGECIRVIHNGADLATYVPSDKPREPFILWISRLQKYKGPTDAVEVLEKLQTDFPDLKLVIVGEGPFRSRLEAFIAKKGLQDKVELTGFISEERKIDLLQRAAVHLQSSYKEGWGLSVIEANACGCPVVANDTTGLRDSCRNNETGLLYRHCDVDDAAAKVRTVLTDGVLRERFVGKGHDWANGFNWERNSREMLEYLQEIIASK